MSMKGCEKMSEIRIAVIGAGANTRLHHIPKLQAQEGVRVVGVCNRSRSSSDKVAGAFGIPRTYDHWTEAIDDPDANAIVIGTWPYLHARATIAALEAGKHVMTEARMACDAAEAHAMLAAAEARPDLVTQVVPSPFSLDVDRTILRTIGEGYLGRILAIEHHMPSGFHNAAAPLNWRKDRDLSGMNIAMMGIFYEMIMRWVGEATRVIALAKTFTPVRPDAEGRPRPVRIPDHLDVLADMACGAQLHLQQSDSTAFLQGGGTYLFGEEGMLRFVDGVLYGARRGDPSASLRAGEAPKPIEIRAEERIGWRVEEEFVGAIRGEEAIRLTTFEDGVKYMEFTEAVHRSLATGRAISLPLSLDS